MNNDGFWCRVGVSLDGHLGLCGGWHLLELEPVSALASLGLTLVQPHELNVGVIFVTDTAHHPVVRHGLDNVGIVLAALSTLSHLAEEGVLKGNASVL